MAAEKDVEHSLVYHQIQVVRHLRPKWDERHVTVRGRGGELVNVVRGRGH
jgi:hypothetical protein